MLFYLHLNDLGPFQAHFYDTTFAADVNKVSEGSGGFRIGLKFNQSEHILTVPLFLTFERSDS